MLELLKRNIVSIICGVIALLAIGAYFWPLGSQQEALKAKAEQQAKAYGSLNSLLTQQRRLPNIPGSPAQGRLTAFPNQQIIDAGKKAVDDLHKEAVKVLSWAVEANKAGHEQLVPGLLPNCGTTLAFRFRDAYQSWMVPQSGRRYARIVPDEMKAGIPPTAEEIQREAQSVRELILGRVAPQLGARQKAERDLKEQMTTLPDRLALRRAMQLKTYVEPDALDVVSLDTRNSANRVSAAPSPSMIWTSQLGFWVQQDALQAIVAANRDANNVLDAPVKRLIKIAVNPKYVMEPEKPAAGDAGASAPQAGGGPPPWMMGPGGAGFGAAQEILSPTARKSNGLYDVIHFSILADVDAARIPAVIQALEKGRFITVFNVEVASVDASRAAVEGFVYGNAPTARVTLRCEALMFRQWAAPLMPGNVKRYLKIASR